MTRLRVLLQALLLAGALVAAPAHAAALDQLRAFLTQTTSARGVARIHSRPSRTPASATSNSRSKSLEPNRIDAGLDGSAACSLRTVAWFRSLSNSVSRSPSATISCS